MLIFLDVETTGVEADDVVCCIAMLRENDALYELLNEGKKIPPLASALHHITNEMIQDKQSFTKSKTYDFLKQNSCLENTLIAHNAKFALEKLHVAGLDWQGDIIDTHRVTKHLIQECEIFSLDFLRYELKLYKKEPIMMQQYGIKNALCEQKALGDAVVTKLLFEYLLDYASIETMKELTFQKVLLQKFPFGKYLGKYIEEIVVSDTAYVRWMLSLSELDEDLRYSLEYYMRG